MKRTRDYRSGFNECCLPKEPTGAADCRASFYTHRRLRKSPSNNTSEMKFAFERLKGCVCAALGTTDLWEIDAPRGQGFGRTPTVPPKRTLTYYTYYSLRCTAESCAKPVKRVRLIVVVSVFQAVQRECLVV